MLIIQYSIAFQENHQQCQITFHGLDISRKRTEGKNLSGMTNQSYTYTPFGKASLILQIREYAPDGTPLARPDTISSRRIIYGPDHQRWQTVLTDSTGVATTISYAPGCDVVQRGSVKTTSYYLEADGALVAIVKATSTYSDLFLAETDHLGNITGLVNESGTEFYTAEFDAWGQRTVTHSGTAVITPGFLPTSSSVSNYMPLRGYTGHEHYMECGLIDMNGRMYDPLTARFLSPDPYVQMPDNPQNFNRYAYCLNNPLMYTDPSGELIWEAILIGAAIYGTGNTIAHGIRGDIESLGDGLKYFGQGALAGAALGAAWAVLPTLGALGGKVQTLMSGAGILQAGAAGIDLAVGVGDGLINDNWSKLQNAGTMLAGNFYLDENRSFLGGAWQGISRYTWELIQTTAGSVIADGRNVFGGVDRVELLGGATFAFNEKYDKNKGFSLGNTLNVYIENEIGDDFVEWLSQGMESVKGTSNKGLNPYQTTMHEYGHYISSQRHGIVYMFVVAPLSALACLVNKDNNTTYPKSLYMSNPYYGFFTERSANRNARNYFDKHYNMIWNEFNYPTAKYW